MTQTSSPPLQVEPLTAQPLSRHASWGISLVHNAWIPLLLVIVYLLGSRFEFANKPGSYVMHVIMMAGINIILAVSLQLINGVSGQFSLGHAGFMAVGAYLAGYATYTFGPLGYDPDADFPDPRALFGNPVGVLLFFAALLLAVIIAIAVIGIIFSHIRRTKAWHPSLPILLTLALLAWVVVDARGAVGVDQIPAWCVWSHGALGLYKLFNGSIVHCAPIAMRLSGSIPLAWRKPMTLFIAMIGGGGAAAIAGLFIGLPTLRLRGDYLAIATLGFAEIIRNVIVTIPALGAATGLSINVYWTRLNLDEQVNSAYYMAPWIFSTAALTLIFIARLVYSQKGKAIQTVRDDEIAAAATGIDPTRHRVLAFVVGAFFAGVAGVLYVHLDGYLNTNSFSFMRSIEIVVMVTLGGLGSLRGATAAAIVLTALPEILDNSERFLPASLARQAHWMADNRLVLYALLLIVIMIARARLRTIRGRKR